MPSNSSSNRLISRRRSDVEIARVTESMRAGNLADRARLDDFDGLDLELLTEINVLLDALTTPLTLTADRLDRLAQGEIPPKIAEEFSGDLASLKDSLNRCIEVLSMGTLNMD